MFSHAQLGSEFQYIQWHIQEQVWRRDKKKAKYIRQRTERKIETHGGRRTNKIEQRDLTELWCIAQPINPFLAGQITTSLITINTPWHKPACGIDIFFIFFYSFVPPAAQHSWIFTFLWVSFFSSFFSVVRVFHLLRASTSFVLLASNRHASWHFRSNLFFLSLLILLYVTTFFGDETKRNQL